MVENALMTSPSKSELLLDAAARAARYVAQERDRPVSPTTEAVDRLGSIDFNATLDRPLDAADVIDMLDEIGGAATVTNTGGRYFGFVTGGVEPVGLAASVLAGAWDQNAALPVMSPVAAHLDALAATWIVDLLGLPTDTVATFCAGAPSRTSPPSSRRATPCSVASVGTLLPTGSSEPHRSTSWRRPRSTRPS